MLGGFSDLDAMFRIDVDITDKRLVEACSRTNTALLGHLRELLGCRDSLEQLIFSALQEEVTRRYGLGWTGRGLAVATSLTWFGKRYHWTRQVGRDVVALDKVTFLATTM